MKSASKRTKSNIVLSATSVQGKASSRSLSGQKKRAATIGQVTPSKRRRNVEPISQQTKPALCLSRFMMKRFQRLKKKAVREAHVEAQLANGVATQIRVLRQQRHWTQALLAKKLGTTQTVVSRMEDPSYAKYSIRSLLEIGHVFDVALHVKYKAFSDFLHHTWDASPEKFQADSYVDEAKYVQVFEFKKNGYVGSFSNVSSANVLTAQFVPEQKVFEAEKFSREFKLGPIGGTIAPIIATVISTTASSVMYPEGVQSNRSFG